MSDCLIPYLHWRKVEERVKRVGTLCRIIGNELKIVNTFTRGNKFFELTNHLGNVLVTVSDKKLQHSTNGTTVDYYHADVVTANDYYPFGSQMPGRKYSQANTTYRYGFNGKENDNEVKGEGNQQDYGMRIYTERLGRFLSVDPLTKSYPHFTPYQFSSNNPILNVDLDGLEGIDYLKSIVVKMDGNSVFPKSDLKNTDYNKVFVIMNGKTANIIHNTPAGVTTIEFNPSSAPSPGKLWFRYGFDQLIAANDYSKKWVRFTDSTLPSMINIATGTEQNAAGFANTFRHYSWQSLLTAGVGEKFAKRYW